MNSTNCAFALSPFAAIDAHRSLTRNRSLTEVAVYVYIDGIPCADSVSRLHKTLQDTRVAMKWMCGPASGSACAASPRLTPNAVSGNGLRSVRWISSRIWSRRLARRHAHTVTSARQDSDGDASCRIHCRIHCRIQLVCRAGTAALQSSLQRCGRAGSAGPRGVIHR